MAKERQEIPATDKWNVEALYPSLEAWKKDFEKWEGRKTSPKFPEIASFRGRLSEGPEKLKALFDAYLEIDRHLSKLYTYAHLRHDEDVANDAHKQAYARAVSLLQEFRQEVSWIEPEILELPEKTYKEAAVLQPYRIYLDRIFRMKPHMLSAEKEELMALAGLSLTSSSRAFGAFNNADLKFPQVEDSSGKLHELTHGKYLLYLRNPDRKLRENAYKAVHTTYASFENLLCELINGEIQSHVFEMKARGYKSCLEAALFPHQIDPSVYLALIETTRGRLKSLHHYMEVRKKLMGLGDLHLYDLHVPLVQSVDMKMSYAEGEKAVVASVAPLGKEYQHTLDKGLLHDRWVDRYENQGKRSGAYSSGCYDSMPYILMNYQGTINDVLTLAHEAGHSMHTYLSSKNQPYCYSQYPIFVAEVASTFNEELLLKSLMEKIKNPKERAFLINQKIEDIRSTFFRQTMFAEFELRLHQWAEQGVPLTPALLKEEYRKLNIDYFGPAVVVDSEADIEWARIPHFYYNFYVYQYATGISAACALFDRLEQEGEKARHDYVQFLSSGSSNFPIELLAKAGVDMRKPQAVISILNHFDALVKQLEEALKN